MRHHHIVAVVIPRLVFLSATLSLFLAAASARRPAADRPQVPCLFVFGDSLVDNGNNNGIVTLARANYMPYGIDFSEGPSGRFTNGRTSADILAQLLGFRHYVPPYATGRGSRVLRGFNFASGAAGIRAETGSNLGGHYYFAEQVEQFRESVQSMRRMFGGNSTRAGRHLSKCIYYVGMGSNDYLNNYFMPNMYITSYQYDPATYSQLLLQEYSRQLTQMYNLGARKVVIVGIGQIGCIPYELARLDSSNSGGGRCNEVINNAIVMYNTGLLRMVQRFNSRFPRAKFVYLNTYDSSRDLVDNAAYYGFGVIDRGCCGVGRNNGQITCLPLQTPCDDRRNHLFWDAFHPTEAANIIYAKKAYYSNSPLDVYPINVRQLARARL